jgi:hypothetical protein
MKCNQCKRSLEDLAKTEDRAILWTSHHSRQILCSDCILAECESLGIEPPDNSLKSINNRRKPK